MTGIVNSTGARSGVIGTTVGTPSGGPSYEEGTWTPATSSGSGARYGFYTKIGNVVVASGHCDDVNAASDTTAFQITGLPFTSAAFDYMSGGYPGPCSNVNAPHPSSLGLSYDLFFYVGPNVSIVKPTWARVADNTVGQMQNVDADHANAALHFTVIYYAA